MTLLFSMLDYLGIEREQNTELSGYRAAEGAKFAATMNDFVGNGYRVSAEIRDWRI